MPISTNLSRYIDIKPNPPHRGGAGETEVPCMIIGFQGANTPNPRNHPHRGGVAGLYHIYINSINLYKKYIIYILII